MNSLIGIAELICIGRDKCFFVVFQFFNNRISLRFHGIVSFSLDKMFFHFEKQFLILRNRQVLKHEN